MVTAFVIDETIILIGNQNFWLCLSIEPGLRSILIIVSQERNIQVIEKFLRSYIYKYGHHIVYIHGGKWNDEACNFIDSNSICIPASINLDGESESIS